MNKQDLQALYRQIKQRKAGSEQNSGESTAGKAGKCGTCGKTAWRPDQG
ncbi:hypothetical protein OYT88_01670 [Sporolactobacillus sp. CQH2019]|nr:hypothetical protein [Sporolactobacillus sp. CQH2019]MDD9147257.1 hypothetical protein [Sporolactobacillus sp. CQH2019]